MLPIFPSWSFRLLPKHILFTEMKLIFFQLVAFHFHFARNNVDRGNFVFFIFPPYDLFVQQAQFRGSVSGNRAVSSLTSMSIGRSETAAGSQGEHGRPPCCG